MQMELHLQRFFKEEFRKACFPLNDNDEKPAKQKKVFCFAEAPPSSSASSWSDEAGR